MCFERLTNVRRGIVTVDLEQLQDARLIGQCRSIERFDCFGNFPIDRDDQMLVVPSCTFPLNDRVLGGEIRRKLATKMNVLSARDGDVLRTMKVER